MPSRLSASPGTAQTAITRMSGSRCSTFHAHRGSSIVSSWAIRASSMASPPSGKADPLAGQVAELESLISCVTPGPDGGELPFLRGTVRGLVGLRLEHHHVAVQLAAQLVVRLHAAASRA